MREMGLDGSGLKYSCQKLEDISSGSQRLTRCGIIGDYSKL